MSEILDYENKMIFICSIKLLTNDINAIGYLLKKNPALFPCLDIDDDMKNKLLSLYPKLINYCHLDDDKIVNAIYKDTQYAYKYIKQLTNDGIIKLLHKFKNDKRKYKITSLIYDINRNYKDFIIKNFDDISVIEVVAGQSHNFPPKFIDNYIKRFPIETTESLEYLKMYPEILIDKKYKDIILPHVLPIIINNIIGNKKTISTRNNINHVVYVGDYMDYMQLSDIENYKHCFNNIKFITNNAIRIYDIISYSKKIMFFKEIIKFTNNLKFHFNFLVPDRSNNVYHHARFMNAYYSTYDNGEFKKSLDFIIQKIFSSLTEIEKSYTISAYGNLDYRYHTGNPNRPQTLYDEGIVLNIMKNVMK